MTDLEWVEHLVIEPGQSLLFKVNEDMEREDIERMSDLIAQRISAPFIVMAGDITITVVDR